MSSTNYYVLKGTSEKIYTALQKGEHIDDQIFDIWLQALAWNIKNKQLDNLPKEYLVLDHYVNAQFTYSNAGDKQDFTLGAAYGSLKLLIESKGD